MHKSSSVWKLIVISILVILFSIFIHDYILGKKGGDYLYNCLSFTESSVEACNKSAKALFYNNVILFGTK